MKSIDWIRVKNLFNKFIITDEDYFSLYEIINPPFESPVYKRDFCRKSLAERNAILVQNLSGSSPSNILRLVNRASTINVSFSELLRLEFSEILKEYQEFLVKNGKQNVSLKKITETYSAKKSPHPNIQPNTEHFIDYIKDSIKDEIYFSIREDEDNYLVWNLHILSKQLFEDKFLDCKHFATIAKNSQTGIFITALLKDVKDRGYSFDPNFDDEMLNLRWKIEGELKTQNKSFNDAIINTYSSNNLISQVTRNTEYRKKLFHLSDLPNRPKDLLYTGSLSSKILTVHLTDEHNWVSL